jgi:uncharacterized delta-60 repeat protein
MARKLGIIALVAFSAAASLLAGHSTNAASIRATASKPGSLDLTFSGDGRVITDFGAYDVGKGVLIQRDGAIVVVGETQSQVNTNIAIVRYKANGDLDSTFGTGGKILADFSSRGEAGVLQPDGKIVVAGQMTGPDATGDFGLVRYEANGSPDASFDGDGKVATDFASGFDWAFAVALQSDGKIVVAGSSRSVVPGARRYDVAIARYNRDGSLDSSFDGDGRVVTAIAPELDAFATDLALQADGRIVVGGYTMVRPMGTQTPLLMRYTAAGALDGSFDGDGVLLTRNAGSGIALQRDGKILTTTGFGAARFNSNGSVDTGFGSGGVASAQFSRPAYAAAIAVQPDGKIVAGGSVGYSFALARFRPNGALDTSFGSGGTVETDLGPGDDAGWDVGVAPDGKVVLAGGSRPTFDGPFDFAVARYTGDPQCRVPNVRRKTLRLAKTAITKAHCGVGKVTRKPSRKVKRGRVISQSPKAGTKLTSLGKVNLVVSRGRK